MSPDPLTLAAAEQARNVALQMMAERGRGEVLVSPTPRATPALPGGTRRPRAAVKPIDAGTETGSLSLRQSLGGTAFVPRMENRGLEPLTSAVRSQRSTS